MNRKGKFGNYEAEYIREHAWKKSPQEIAAHLKRTQKSVTDYIKNHIPKPGEEGQAEIRKDLRSSLAWIKLKDEFTDDELAYFEEEYVGLMEQFKEDVFKTEEQQIRKAITLDILMRRNMAARKKLLADISRVESWQEKAAKEFKAGRAGMGQEEKERREEFLLNLETQLAGLRSAEQSKTKEYADLDNRHQKLMEALKATREQRISKVESGRQSFLGILRDLQSEERRQAEGRQMGMMQRATRKEHARLSRKHVYDDGQEDRPVLSAETVVLPDEEE